MRYSRGDISTRFSKLYHELRALKEQQLINAARFPYYYPASLDKVVSADGLGFAITTFTFTANNQVNPMVDLKVASSNTTVSYVGLQVRQTGRTATSVTFTVKTHINTGSTTFTARAVATDNGVIT